VIPNNASGWFERQYRDIKGNFKWALALLVKGGIVAAAVALTHGLLQWQQAALAGCFVLLFGWALAVTFARKPHTESLDGSIAENQPVPKEAPDLSQAIGPQFDSEMKRLTLYEQFAVGRLMEIDGMTGEQFLARMREWSFPTATAAGDQCIIDTFENINRKTTLLTEDPHSGVWSLRRAQTRDVNLKQSPHQERQALIESWRKMVTETQQARKYENTIVSALLESHQSFPSIRPYLS
jgi:hypothetical protein